MRFRRIEVSQTQIDGLSPTARALEEALSPPPRARAPSSIEPPAPFSPISHMDLSGRLDDAPVDIGADRTAVGLARRARAEPEGPDTGAEPPAERRVSKPSAGSSVGSRLTISAAPSRCSSSPPSSLARRA